MHPDQFNAFRDQIPFSENRKKHTEQPFVHAGHTYATDGRFMIRHPGAIEGFKVFEVEKEEEATQKFLRSVPPFFAFFEAPVGELVSLATLNLEPVVSCEPVRFGERDFENPQFDQPTMGFVLQPTITTIRRRCFDARRLLHIRQTLPDARFYDEPEAGEETALRFVFGDGGQGVLMPVRVRPGVTKTHWNGAIYCPGGCF